VKPATDHRLRRQAGGRQAGDREAEKQGGKIYTFKLLLTATSPKLPLFYLQADNPNKH